MGFEPTTSAVTGRRSNQLSHRAIQVFNIPSKPHTENLSIRYNNLQPRLSLIGFQPIS